MDVLRFYFSLRGRISRNHFWLAAWFPISLVGLLILELVFALLPDESGHESIFKSLLSSPTIILLAPIVLVLCWASFATMIKRLHDRDISAFWLLPMLLVVGAGSLSSFLNPQSFVIIDLIMQTMMFISMPINLWLFVNLYFLRGTLGPNKYGPRPF